MRTLPAYVLCMLMLAGCAGGPIVECHGTQWYRLGLDDGAAGASGEAERYATSCGADFNRASYQQGFQDGLARRPQPPAGAGAGSAAGTYAAVVPAGSGGGERQVSVVLQNDGTATVSSAVSGRPSRFTVTGTWQQSGERVVVNTDLQRLVFDYAGNRLVAREWDRAAWGEAGPGTLQRLVTPKMSNP